MSEFKRLDWLVISGNDEAVGQASAEIDLMEMVSLVSEFLQGLGIAVIAALLYERAARLTMTSLQRNLLVSVMFSVGTIGPALLAVPSSSGFSFDIGNVFVVLAMAYGGWITLTVTTAVAVLGRLWLGGAAVASSVLAVLICSAISLAFAQMVKGRRVSIPALAGVGLLASVSLISVFLLPREIAMETLGEVASVAIVANVVAAVVIGRILELQRSHFGPPRLKEAPLGTTDTATGLLNRRVFDKLGPELAAAMNWAGQPYSMALIDIDEFDQVVEAHGHAAGEQTLRHVASVVQSAVRQTDMVASFGGQAIALVLPAYDAERAFGLAERIQNAVADTPFHLDGIEIPLTVSVGLHTPLPRKESFWIALGQADTALNRAKSTGGNRLEVAV
ncbi:GGDEF domain-containing protein [Nitratireductor rhodophyticola]|uniref:GGDEF domain-containing protein n=2 Tax=Nitratireductor rhodophyticola TaxID=2854036 RepID=UPI003BA8B9F7